MVRHRDVPALARSASGAARKPRFSGGPAKPGQEAPRLAYYFGANAVAMEVPSKPAGASPAIA